MFKKAPEEFGVVSAGGKALALGMWYQTATLIAGALSDWSFKDDPGDLDGGALYRITEREAHFAPEYLDMDGAVFRGDGMVMAQFKASSQQSPRNFTRKELGEILKNAALALSEHKKQSDVPLRQFLLVSNRGEGGAFSALSNLRKRQEDTDGKDVSFDEFRKLATPSSLYNSSQEKNMEEYAVLLLGFGKKKLTESQAAQVDACLEIMYCYDYRKVTMGMVRDELESWLTQWGFFKRELSGTIVELVGQLIHPAAGGTTTNPSALVQTRIGGPEPLPLTVGELAPRLSRELTQKSRSELSAYEQYEPAAEGSWMIDRREQRSKAVQALKSKTPDTRLIVLSGPGGVGKTALLHQVLWEIMGRDPESNDQVPAALGWGPCLAIKFEAPGKFTENLQSRIASVSGREPGQGSMEERVAVANQHNRTEFILCLALDGLDEVSSVDLASLVEQMKDYLRSHKDVRIIVTCRQDEGEWIEDHWRDEGLLLPIRVELFDSGEAFSKLRSQLNINLIQPSHDREYSRQSYGFGGRDYSDVFDERLYDAIRHPLMFGTIHAMISDGKKSVISNAARGDEEALQQVAHQFVAECCRRIANRLRTPSLKRRHVFEALRKLASENDSTKPGIQKARMGICDVHEAFGSGGNRLHRQCVSLGLIEPTHSNSGVRWRHPFVGEYLKVMEEPVWR